MIKEYIEKLYRQLKPVIRGKGPSLLASLDDEIRRLRLRIGVDRAPSTLRTLLVIRKRLGCYICLTTGKEDVMLSALTPAFIENFSNYLFQEAHLSSTTIKAYTAPLKYLVRRAHQEGVIVSNPFAQFHIASGMKSRVFLTAAELQQLMDLTLDSSELCFVRDMFLFASFTGLSFIDLQLLRREEIVYINGDAWIISRRQKTRTSFQVRLFELPLRIMAQWGAAHAEPDALLFSLYGYRRMSRKLSVVIQRCGLTKHVTWHSARHTFATLALNNGMPIESVSRALGHTKISTTQIYAKLSLEKLGLDFETFNQNLHFNCKSK